MKLCKKFLVAGLMFAAFADSLQAQTALQFNGTNQYVTMGAATSTLGTATFTLECWFKRTNASGAAGVGTVTGGNGFNGSIIPLVSKGRGEADGSNVDCNYIMGLQTTTSLLVADFEEGPGGALLGLNHPVCGSTAITDTSWHHAAATYSSAGGWSLYLDGVAQTVGTACSNCQSTSPVNCLTNPGATPRSDSIQHFGIASALTSTGAADGYFAGAIDEVRVWNIVRTPAQISGSMNQQLTSGTGLIGRWGFNDGSGSSAANSIAGSPAGTLTNGPTWVSGAPALTANQPPNQPTLVTPANGASGVSTSPMLTVNVTDPESNPMTVTFFGRANAIPAAGPDFTIIALPDTQFYSCGSVCGSNTAIFASQLQWIVDNKTSRNIAFVTQLGDCVQDGNDGNANGANAEWDVASAAFSLIENPATTGLTFGIPFGIAVGNHDQTPINSPRSGADEGATTTRYNNTFGVSRFSGRSYYGGRYDFGAPATYPNNNDNHYELFSAGGLNFIIIHLEFDPSANATRTAAINWANGLLQANSSRRGIVVSHYILNPDGTFGDQGQAIYDGLKGNTNLFLMMCGHLDQANRRADTFAGNTINTLLSDYQTLAPSLGNGYLRILSFSPANNTISVTTYSPWLNQSLTDASNQFTLSYSMSGSPPPFTQIGSPVTSVASGTNASVVWSGLAASTTHDWKVTVSDGTSTINSPTWSFATSCTGDAACDDGNPCTTDTCSNGVCVHTNNTNSCNDGLLCTVNDTCSNGTCVGTPVTCTSGATCNPANGHCEFAPVTVTFQQGVSGYTGTVDTYLNIGEAAVSKATASTLIVDLVGSVGSPLGINQALLRFDNIFGTGAGQIPPGATIQSATLTVFVSNENVSAPATMYRMLQSWSDGNTWSTFGGNGIQADDAEAWATPDVPSVALAAGLQSMTVTSSLITWNLNPSANRGWAILPSATIDNGLGIDSSEGTTIANRPKLSVTYIPPPPCQTNADCNDNSACTTDTCNNGTCQYTTISCDDSNACTTDTCNTSTGCVHTAISCDDGDGCTDDACNPATGCAHTPVNCDDGNSCTTDSCQPANTAAVALNGTSQYVSLGTGTAVTNFGTGSFTIEGWFKLAATPAANVSLFRMGRSGSFPQAVVQILASTNTIAASVETNASPSQADTDTTTGVAVSLNTWTHFAAVADRTVGAQRLRLYVNGALVRDVDASIWSTNAISTTDASVLGAARASDGTLNAFYSGTLDEVRLWNTIRSQAQIQSNMNVQLTSASGLIGRWGLNEGTGTSTVDSVSANNGTLTGGATWVTGAANLVNMGSGGCIHTPIANCCTSDAQCNDNDTCTADTCSNGTCIHTPISCDDGDPCTTDTCSPATGCAHTPLNCDDGDGCTVDTCVNGTCQHVVNCDDGNPCTVDSCAPGNTAALSFDGSNDYVTMGAAPGLNASQFTLECWFKRTGTGVANQTGGGGIALLVPLISKGSSEADTPSNLNMNYVIGIDTSTNTIGVDFEEATGANTGLNHPATVPTTPSSNVVVNNTWYHAAATYDGASWRIYLNGNLVHTLAVGAAPEPNSIQHFGLGTMLNSTGSPLGFFQGVLDEVRVWNVARSQAQIQSAMNSQITSAPNLIGRWGLNDGAGTTAADSSGNSHPGTLTNGPAWVTTNLVNIGGGCVHTPVTDGTACTDDNNACTTDVCFNGSCVHNALANGTACTTDNNPCTVDACSGGACSHTLQDADGDGVCDSSDLCPNTPHGETPNAQGCSCSQVNCNDNNPCTLDTCVNGTCSHTFQDADGDGVCDFNDTCPNTPNGQTPNAQGCSCSQVNCNDNDPCTQDSCTNGVCSHVYQDADGDGVCDASDACPNTPAGQTPNAQGCSCNQVNCDDSNVCTIDTCSNGVCTHTPVSCDDNDASTTDTCDAVNGCQHTPIDCDDDNACTNDTHDSVNGCNHTPVNCDDGNPCTTDGCNPATGCTHTLLDADDDGVCDSVDQCPDTPGDETANANGCSCSQVNCDDNEPCTLDSCANGICSHTFQDADGDGVCDAVDQCPETPGDETANANGCSCSQVICNDNDPCTHDTCVNGVCSNTFQDADGDGVCDANDTCPSTPNGQSPNSQGCSCSQVNCDDSNPCTLDTCANGVCSHVLQDADGDGVCDVIDTCPNTPNGQTPNSQGCSCSQVNCDDSNPCTLDTCANGVCSHTIQDADGDGVCDANDTCPSTPNGQIPNSQGCSCSQVNCDDGDPCTADSCVNGACTHSPISPCYQLSLNVLGNSQICAGDHMNVALNVAGLQQALNGVQVLLQYDPSRLSLNSISAGDGITSPWNQAAPTLFSDSGGSVVYAWILIGTSTSADATVATLHFTALNPGLNTSPASVVFRPDSGNFQTKLTTATNSVILPTKLDATPVTVGPQIQVTLQIQGLTHPATRAVTFIFADCQNLASPETVTRSVSFNSSGMGSILLTGVGAGAEWITATEGHTLRRRLLLIYGGSCFTSVSFTGANQLVTGDFQTSGVPQDNLVDIVDFAILFSRFNSVVSDCSANDPNPQNCSLGADVNGDGIQETADFTAIQINFFQVGDASDSCLSALAVSSDSDLPVSSIRQAGKPRSSVRVAELARVSPSLGMADLNRDGRIDAADIRAFSTRNRIPLLPSFETRLQQIEASILRP